MIIRSEQLQDIPIIYAINKAAFSGEGEAKLVNLLRKGDTFISSLSLVALIDEQPVGYVLFTKIQIVQDEKSLTESLALAPVAVLPAFQNQGIGSSLIKEGLRLASQSGFLSVIVLGHAGYYPRFGFKPASYWNIKPPFDVPDTSFMAIELEPHALDNVTGTVQYPRAFMDV